MATEPIVIAGVVRNGVVVPQGDTPLPEGAQVSIVVPQPEPPAPAPAEGEVWEEKVGDLAPGETDQWEREE